MKKEENQNQELTLLAPKERVQCEQCKKWKSKKSIKKAKDGRKLCAWCRRWHVVTNKFYNPLTSKQNRIGKYNMTDEEKNILKKQLMDKGLTFHEANREVARHLGILQAIKKRKRYDAIQMTYARREQSQQNKRFVGGLK